MNKIATAQAAEAAKYEAFKLSPSEQGRFELTLFKLTDRKPVKEIGELLGKQS